MVLIRETLKLPTVRYQTVSRGHVLLATVKCDSIVRKNYELLGTKTLKEDLERVKINNNLFCSTHQSV